MKKMMTRGGRNIVNFFKFSRYFGLFLFYMRRKSPKFYSIKRPPRINAPLKIEKFNKRPRRLIEVIRYRGFGKSGGNVNMYLVPL